jgi:hypothetical protein
MPRGKGTQPRGGWARKLRSSAQFVLSHCGAARRPPIGLGRVDRDGLAELPGPQKKPRARVNARRGAWARLGWGAGKRRVIGSTAPAPDCSGAKKKPRGVQEGVLTAGQGSSALALGGRLSAPDNPTRQIVSIKQNGRQVAPTAGLRLRRFDQATRRFSAEDLPVLRSATSS